MYLDDLNEDQKLKEGDDCPNCDGTLETRYGRQFGGSLFLGCNRFPKCDFTFDLKEI